MEGDEKIKKVNTQVIKDCIIAKKPTEGGNDEPDAPGGFDFQRVKDHLLGVFGCLITREDLTSTFTGMQSTYMYSIYIRNILLFELYVCILGQSGGDGDLR